MDCWKKANVTFEVNHNTWKNGEEAVKKTRVVGLRSTKIKHDIAVIKEVAIAPIKETIAIAAFKDDQQYTFL